MSINVSEGFRAYYANGGAPFVSVTYLPSGGSWASLSSERVCMGGVTVEGATSPVNSFAIGAAIVGTATVALANFDGMFDSWDFEGMQLRPRAVAIVNGSPQYATLGTYDVEPPESLGSVVTLRCRDLMGRFERAYSDVQTAYPATLYDIVDDICDACGVSMAQSSFPNSDYVVQARPSEDLSCIDVISCVAQIACCFARMDEVGRLAFGWYDMGAFGEGGTHRSVTMLRSLEVGVADVTITGVRVTAQDADPDADGAPGAVGETALAGAEGYVLPIEGNPLVLNGQAAAVAALVAPRVVGLAFRPLDASVLGDPSVTAGDAVAVTDRLGRTFETYLTNVTWSSGGSQRLACGAATPGRQSGRGRTGLLALAVEQVRRAVRLVEAATAAARAVADEASLVASATDQHFWTDDDGVHVTQVSQDDWRDEQSASHHGGPNLLANSLGILLRTGLSNLVSVTQSAIAFYDGIDNSASNIVALFGSSLARVGKESGGHVDMTSSGMEVLVGSNSKANFGSTTRIGIAGGVRTEVTGSGMSLFDEDDRETLNISCNQGEAGWSKRFCSIEFDPIEAGASPYISGRGDTVTGDVKLSLNATTNHGNDGSYLNLEDDGITLHTGASVGGYVRYAAIDMDGASKSIDMYGSVSVTGGMTVGGDVIANNIGTIVSDNDTKSVASGTGTDICSVTLDPGTWLIEGNLAYLTNATGRRIVTLSTTAGNATSASILSQTGVEVPATSGGYTALHTTWITKRTAQSTIYLNAYQDSGGALSVTGYLRAMRIA